MPGGLRPRELVQRDAMPARRDERTARPVRDVERALRTQPAASCCASVATRSATRYTRIARSPGTWSVSSTTGGPEVSSIAATLVPIASIAKRTWPPSTSVKYAMSLATSRLGV